MKNILSLKRLIPFKRLSERETEVSRSYEIIASSIRASPDNISLLLADCRDRYSKPIVEALFRHAVKSQEVIEPLLRDLHGNSRRKWNWTLVAVFALSFCFHVTSILEIANILRIDDSTVKGYINLIYVNLGLLWESKCWDTRAQRRGEARALLTRKGYLKTNLELLVLVLNF